MARAVTAHLDPATTARLRAWAATWPVLRLVVTLTTGEQPVHLVGGAVRDLLLGRMPKDADLVLAGPIEALARRLADETGSARVPLHDNPPTERIVLAGGRTLDLAAYRGPDLITDLRARDFTVNAMALPLAALLGAGPAVLVDPTGGQFDLQRRTVRVTSPASLRADPLRLLRAYRLVATGWRLAPATERLIRRGRRGLRRPARERVAAELIQILAADRAWTAVRAMTHTGVLHQALPTLAPVSPQHWPALRRLGRARRHLSALVGPARAERLSAMLAEEINVERPRVALLGWLALALETARARRCTPAATVRLVARLADSLRCGRREAGEATRIAQVLAEGDALAVPVATGLTRELLGSLGAAAPGALLLAWALGPTTGHADPAGRRRQLHALLDLYWQTVAPLLDAPPLLDGQTLMHTFGLTPGPAVGQVLAAIRSARLRGELATPDEALALAQRLLTEQRRPHHPAGPGE